MQTNPAMAKDNATPGPAKLAAAVPVRTKIPVPIVLPIPRSKRSNAPKVFLSDFFSASAIIDFIDLVRNNDFIKNYLKGLRNIIIILLFIY